MNKDQNANLFIYNGSLPNSPAAKSNLLPGDKILSINGVTLLNLEDLNLAIKKDSSKRVIEVLRGVEILSIELNMPTVDKKRHAHNMDN